MTFCVIAIIVLTIAGLCGFLYLMQLISDKYYKLRLNCIENWTEIDNIKSMMLLEQLRDYHANGWRIKSHQNMNSYAGDHYYITFDNNRSHLILAFCGSDIRIREVIYHPLFLYNEWNNHDISKRDAILECMDKEFLEQGRSYLKKIKEDGK